MKGTGKIIEENKEFDTHRWEKKRSWMPQKSSRYPPIHDQIDTPTDFSMAVMKTAAEER